jgi:transmembrane sensor
MDNNFRAFESASTAEDQARAWIVRIDGGPLSAEDRERLYAWLTQDPEHRRLLDEYALTWSTASLALKSAAGNGTRARATKRDARWNWVGACAGALGVALLAVVLWSPTLLPHSPEPVPVLAMASQYSTRTGERLQVNLDDGSRVAMNTATALQVTYGSQRRRVVLDRGDGLFDVAKDPGRPFEVLAGHTLVRAVGTRFMVERSISGRVDVTVVEGVVEMQRLGDDGSQPVRLAAGQSAIDLSGKTTLMTLSPLVLERRTAWEQGRIVFDATPLSEAVRQINRYAQVPLRLADARLAAVRVSGAFSTDDVGIFVSGLEQGFGLRSERRSDAILISRGKPPAEAVAP